MNLKILRALFSTPQEKYEKLFYRGQIFAREQLAVGVSHDVLGAMVSVFDHNAFDDGINDVLRADNPISQ